MSINKSSLQYVRARLLSPCFLSSQILAAIQTLFAGVEEVRRVQMAMTSSSKSQDKVHSSFCNIFARL